MRALLCLCLFWIWDYAVCQNYALRFYGNGVDDIDRIKIRIDDPEDNDDPGPPVDIGAADFSVEFWMKANADDNNSDPVSCGANNNWISGNIIIDRDRYNQGRNYGISVAGGFIVFGTMGTFGDAYTICSDTDVLDDQWHHIAVQRRRSDGWMWLYIDGALEAQANGPNGDISYPDDGVPGNFCGGPCTNSDPFIVIGAEKHDAGPDYPSYNGYIDEIRFSNSLRYSSDFAPPSVPFVVDANTVGLYRLETGAGDIAYDASGSGSPNGEINIGGSPPGPVWVTDTPFTILDLEAVQNTETDRKSRFTYCRIFPNPAQDIMRFDRCEDVRMVELMDINGVSCFRDVRMGYADVSGIARGYYIVRVCVGTEVVVLPLVVQ